MDMSAWILICLFASVGLVQCGLWMLEAFKKPKELRRGYHVIPLYDNAEELEAQIRFGLSQIRRAGNDGEYILLVDMGLGEECMRICDNLLHGTGGVYICEKAEMAETIAMLDNLQNGSNVVE